ncbi:MAG: PAS domain S-box protein [Bacteroidetes bacterium]|nr:PAS domain S-box protein [Bacteroidota bacterium]MBU1720105.1 PAS domain S-box protein [Bacteroidota bacterium]
MKPEQSYAQLLSRIQELEKQSDYYKLIADNTYDWEVFRDCTGTIKYVNKAFERITGFSCEKVLDGTITEKDVVHPDDWSSISEQIKLSVKQLPVTDLEFRIIRADKQIRHVNLCAAPVFEGGTFVGTRASVRDITEQKDFTDLQVLHKKVNEQTDQYLAIIDDINKVKERVEASELKLKEAQQLAKIGNWELDLVNNVLYWSDEIFRIFGCEPQEFGATYEAFLGFIHPDDREMVNEAYTRHLQTRTSYNIIHRIVLKQGEVRYVHEKCKSDFDMSGKPLRSVGTVAEITDSILIQNELQVAKESAEESERNLQTKNEQYEAINEELRQTNEELYRAKEKAEESENQIRSMFSVSNAGIVLIDTKGSLLEWNETFRSFFGYSQEEFRTFSSKTLTFPDDMPESLDKISKLVSRQIGNFRIEKRFVRKDKTVFWADLFAAPLIKGENVYAIIGVVNDITERKQTEIELIAAKEKAEESNRLKTAFLQNISHEIRTPLNAICGFSGMLNDSDISEEKRKSYVSIIQSSSDQLLSIVSDILTISAIETKQEQIRISKVSINDTIVELLSIFKPQALRQNISLYVKQEFADEQVEIFTDKAKFTQILSNLLTNAMKFTHEGYVEFGYALKGENIEFYVKDSGIGIQREMQEMVFDRFRQGDKSIQVKYGGTGLGLSISKGFVELLGGTIWVQSEIGQGSIFYFTIPYNPVIETNSTSAKPNQSGDVITVVVAEDEEYNYLFIEELLINMGLKIIHAKNGQETVDLCKTDPNIGLILMDIKMPVMDGHTAAMLIKELRPDLPIIAQSAHALEHEIEQYSGIFDAYYAKPIDREKFMLTIISYVKNK